MSQNEEKTTETPMQMVGTASERPQVTRYPVEPSLRDQIENNFSYHAPKGDQAERYEKIRRLARVLALEICELCPESDERTQALYCLEDVSMSANASIARHE